MFSAHLRTLRGKVVLATAVAAFCGALAAGCRGAYLPEVSPEAARAETVSWRATHEADYRREWSTIAGLHVLRPGTNTAGSAPSNDIVLPASAPATLGRFVLDGTTVRFEPDAAAQPQVQLGGRALGGPLVLADDGSPEPDRLAVGSLEMVVHVSGERRTLRVWDPDGELARGFLGFRWFDIQPAYRVVARFIPDATPRRVKVSNTLGDIDTFETEGVVEFELEGRALRLRAFTTAPKRLYFVFKDASSGDETYGAARFLYADLRDDGTAILDFNQAYNPPCAFNPYTTCPIPLPENRLPIKVLAGERAYPEHPTPRS